jgi:hypothetical protein
MDDTLWIADLLGVSIATVVVLALVVFGNIVPLGVILRGVRPRLREGRL